MKEILHLFAEYNLQTNRALFEILEKLSPDQFTKDVGAFYKSILGILTHMIMADAGWVTRITGLIPELASVATKMPEVHWKEFSAKMRENGGKFPETLPFNTLAAVKTVRTAMDAVITQMVDQLTENQLKTLLTWKNFRGEEQKKKAWHMIMHVFNHQTHHRGGLAVMLDILGVENDYSNLISLPS